MLKSISSCATAVLCGLLFAGGTQARAQTPSWGQCPLNGHWYTLTPSSDWDQTEQQSVAWGGHLATIRSSTEDDWLSVHFVGQAGLWIGLYNLSHCGGTWQWVSGEPITFTSWQPNQPDCNFNTDCSSFGWEQKVEANYPCSGCSGTLMWNNNFGGCPRPGIAELVSPDCDGNGVPDLYEVRVMLASDCNGNGVPDACDALSGHMDCNGNGQVDTCEIAQGTAPDANGNGIPDGCEGIAFCFGDAVDTTHTTVCPCGNSGSPGHGCANSVNATGALLSGSGVGAYDSVEFHGSLMPASSLCIYLQGDALTDVVFGDGVLCTGGGLIRLRTKLNAGGASAYPEAGDPSVSSRGQVAPGSGAQRYYQTYYRNPASAFCPPATFNVTNGVVVMW